MKYQERSFAGKIFRPRPTIVTSFWPELGFVVTPWGDGEECDRAIQMLSDHISATGDLQKMSQCERFDMFIEQARRLNEYLYSTINGDEYRCALEIASFSMQNGVLSWVQVGCPHLLLQSHGSLSPLSIGFDLSWQYGQMAPIVGAALGVNEIIDFNRGQIYLRSPAQLISISRACVPSKIFATNNHSILELSKILVEDSSEVPFWLAQFQL